MNQANIEPRQAMAQRKPQLRLSAIQRYGLAVLSVSLALGGALFVERFHVREVEIPLFLFAIAISAWYGGTGPPCWRFYSQVFASTTSSRGA
jgi:hypothetical protein